MSKEVIWEKVAIHDMSEEENLTVGKNLIRIISFLLLLFVFL